jgi:hypothetical protein
MDGFELFDYSGLKVRKANGTQKLFGKVFHRIEVDNSIEVEIFMYSKRGGSYMPMPYRLQKKGSCIFHQEDSYYYKELANATTFPYPYPCPLPAVRF